MAAIVLGLIVVVGCGDSGSDEDQITATIESYAEAIRDGDGEAFCGTLTEELRNAIGPDAEDCERAVTEAKFQQGDSFDPEAREIVVTGDSATANVTSGNAEWDMKFERVDNQWLISVAFRFPNRS